MITRKVLFIALAVLALASLIGTAQAQPPAARGCRSRRKRFHRATGVLADPDGNIWVIDSGIGGDEDIEVTNPETGEQMMSKMGKTAQVVKVTPDGDQTVVANLPSVAVSETETVGGARLAIPHVARL